MVQIGGGPIMVNIMCGSGMGPGAMDHSGGGPMTNALMICGSGGGMGPGLGDMSGSGGMMGVAM